MLLDDEERLSVDTNPLSMLEEQLDDYLHLRGEIEKNSTIKLGKEILIVLLKLQEAEGDLQEVVELFSVSLNELEK